MKRILCFLPCLLFTASLASAQTDVEATIRKLELDFNLAYEKDDLDAYFSYYAPGATLWFITGRVALEDYKRDWYGLVEGGGEVEKATVSDLRVQVGPSRDTAVATYVLDVVTRYGDARRVTEQAWESDVWFLTGGEWKIAHIHYTSRELN